MGAGGINGAGVFDLIPMVELGRGAHASSSNPCDADAVDFRDGASTGEVTIPPELLGTIGELVRAGVEALAAAVAKSTRDDDDFVVSWGLPRF